MRTRACTVSVYKDRVGNWRWKIVRRGGFKIGASMRSFSHRCYASANLYDVTGVRVQSPRHVKGDLRKRFRVLGERSIVQSVLL
jgi:hypothetical protein